MIQKSNFLGSHRPACLFSHLTFTTASVCQASYINQAPFWLCFIKLGPAPEASSPTLQLNLSLSGKYQQFHHSPCRSPCASLLTLHKHSS